MHKRSFGWITIKSYNEIKGLKVPTYDHHCLIGFGYDGRGKMLFSFIPRLSAVRDKTTESP
jgi:hypothetical protein